MSQQMKTIGQLANGAAAERKAPQTGLERPSQTSLQNNQAHKWTGDDMRGLTKLLGAALLLQRSFGKQGGDIKETVVCFRYALRDLHPQAVLEALDKWVCHEEEFPTPGGIRKKINPVRTLDRAVYTGLRRKADRDGSSVTPDEWAYIRRYERQAMEDAGL